VAVSLSAYVPDSSVPHAIALALLTIHDSKLADVMDLQFDVGFWRRVRLPPQLLRLGEQLPGHWQAALHLRTDHQGRLGEHLHVIDLHPPAPDLLPFVWSAAGRLVEGPGRAELVTVRVSPGQRRVRPFLVSAMVTPQLWSSAEKAAEVTVGGDIQAEVLVATSAVKRPVTSLEGPLP
jgi:hypothetical protein